MGANGEEAGALGFSHILGRRFLGGRLSVNGCHRPEAEKQYADEKETNVYSGVLHDVYGFVIQGRSSRCVDEWLSPFESAAAELYGRATCGFGTFDEPQYGATSRIQRVRGASGGSPNVHLVGTAAGRTLGRPRRFGTDPRTFRGGRATAGPIARLCTPAGDRTGSGPP